MLRNALKVLVPAILLIVAGCRVAPVYEVQQAPIPSPRAASVSEVERAIRTAGTGLGWQMLPRGPGHIEGTLLQRDHRAVVDIKFDSRTYNIKYRDSSNLGYDGSTIHSNYNVWVQSLDQAIRAQLSAL